MEHAAKRKRHFLLLNLLATLIVSLIFYQFSAISQTINKNPKSQLLCDSVLNSLPGIDFEYISAMQGVKHTLPFVKYLFLHPGEIPKITESFRFAIASSKTSIQDLSHQAFQLLGASAGGFGPPLSGTVKSTFVADLEGLNKMITKLNLKINQTEEWQKLPFNFQKWVIEIIADMHDAKVVFDQFSNPFQKYLLDKNARSNQEILDALMIPWQQREIRDFSSVDIIEKVDLKKLSLATRIATSRLSFNQFTQNTNEFSNFTGCTIQSDIGKIRINGPENDTVQNDFAPIIDTGGDDVYLGNTASSISFQQPFGIVVDLAGDDKYIGEKSTASGILGIGVLLDLSGDDYYETHLPGMGFSLYGSSVLYDSEGNDTYVSHSEYSQAASIAGISMFVDISGDDSYACKSYSQGFGGTLGAGIFFDNRGIDQYNLNTETEYLPNFIQGTAKGRWAEATDGQSLAGGIGIFIDDYENDSYRAGGFSQGASYYFGLGLFYDTSGNDKYDAISHSQGYAAHCSLAGFTDEKGDDEYNVSSDFEKITQIIGGGRDFSAGIFIEKEGDDIYHLGNRSAGTGDIYGIGVLADWHGDDKYIWHKNRLNSNSESLGKKAGLTENMTIGFHLFAPKESVWEALFIDKAGENTFEEY